MYGNRNLHAFSTGWNYDALLVIANLDAILVSQRLISTFECQVIVIQTVLSNIQCSSTYRNLTLTCFFHTTVSINEHKIICCIIYCNYICIRRLLLSCLYTEVESSEWFAVYAQSVSHSRTTGVRFRIILKYVSDISSVHLCFIDADS